MATAHAASETPQSSPSPNLVDPTDLTVFLRFKDGSQAVMAKGTGWIVQIGCVDDDFYFSELWQSGRYFTDSMAAKWCETWRELCPDMESVGICTA